MLWYLFIRRFHFVDAFYISLTFCWYVSAIAAAFRDAYATSCCWCCHAPRWFRRQMPLMLYFRLFFAAAELFSFLLSPDVIASLLFHFFLCFTLITFSAIAADVFGYFAMLDALSDMAPHAIRRYARQRCRHRHAAYYITPLFYSYALRHFFYLRHFALLRLLLLYLFLILYDTDIFRHADAAMLLSPMPDALYAPFIFLPCRHAAARCRCWYFDYVFCQLIAIYDAVATIFLRLSFYLIRFSFSYFAVTLSLSLLCHFDVLLLFSLSSAATIFYMIIDFFHFFFISSRACFLRHFFRHDADSFFDAAFFDVADADFSPIHIVITLRDFRCSPPCRDFSYASAFRFFAIFFDFDYVSLDYATFSYFRRRHFRRRLFRWVCRLCRFAAADFSFSPFLPLLISSLLSITPCRIITLPLLCYFISPLRWLRYHTCHSHCHFPHAAADYAARTVTYAATIRRYARDAAASFFAVIFAMLLRYAICCLLMLPLCWCWCHYISLLMPFIFAAYWFSFHIFAAFWWCWCRFRYAAMQAIDIFFYGFITLWAAFAMPWCRRLRCRYRCHFFDITPFTLYFSFIFAYDCFSLPPLMPPRFCHCWFSRWFSLLLDYGLRVIFAAIRPRMARLPPILLILPPDVISSITLLSIFSPSLTLSADFRFFFLIITPPFHASSFSLPPLLRRHYTSFLTLRFHFRAAISWLFSFSPSMITPEPLSSPLRFSRWWYFSYAAPA